MKIVDVFRRAVGLSLDRKVRVSRWALLFERLWPKVWLIIGICALFVMVSMAGLWETLGATSHKFVLGLFGVALATAFVLSLRIKWPTRDETVRRMERVSGVPHRPASSYEDTLSANADNPSTRKIWDAHKRRLAQSLSKMKIGPPHPRADRQDPFALRMLMILAAVLFTALVGQTAPERLAAAFDFRSGIAETLARLDVWVAPPVYTGKPPLMLADGGDVRNADGAPTTKDQTRFLEVPVRSILIARLSGEDGAGELSLEVLADGKDPVRVNPEPQDATKTSASPQVARSTVIELRHELTAASRVRLLASGEEVDSWTFALIPDEPPAIALTRDPSKTQRGTMKLSYSVSDDYGLHSAEAKVRRAPTKRDEQTMDWARSKELKGPRPPYERPPELSLRLPKAGSEKSETFTRLELGQHPWAGLRVIMQLEAKDTGGQTGRSKSFEIVLPQRKFSNPIAKAIIEQRRKLAEDPRNRRRVMRALDALTLEPEGFLDDAKAYLGLRTAYHRLGRDRSRAGRNSVIDQLWHVAVRIEDGDLSDAERRLREAQEKLAKALKDGASDKEIEEAMRELRQALNDFMKQMQKQAGDNPLQPGQDEQSQMLSQQDLDKMLRDIEEMAKSGARDQAEQMLSQMRDMLDRLQSNKEAQRKAERGRQMQKQMNELGDMTGKQQQLMDDTFGKQRQQRGQQQGRMPGQQRQGGQQQGGQRGQGQPGQRGQGKQDPQGSQPSPGPMGADELGQRQRALRDRLAELQQRLDELGMGSPQQLDGARQSMEEAENSLREGDLDNATRAQSNALDQMRQGAQSMAREMQEQGPRQYGQEGQEQKDPLGRPQRSKGPQSGDSVRVPDKIDMQQAREILQELRRRLGEATRTPEELDYIERLLRRF